MRKIKDSLFTTPLGALLMVVMFSNAYADEPFICNSYIDNQTIDGEVIVPSGETCELYEVTVNGNVAVQKNAIFTILSSSTINGNLSANQADEINITELRLYGNISIVNSGNIDIQQATVIFGNAHFEGNDFVDLFEQAIFGNTIISKNKQVDVADVGIQGNLIMVKNELVNANPKEDFNLSVFGNAACLQNDEINGVIDAQGKNNGCPLPP